MSLVMRYHCIGQPCTAPSGIPDAPAVPCTEGSLIPHGETCTLFCDEGFFPSLANLSCNATRFDPSNFSWRLVSFCRSLKWVEKIVELWEQRSDKTHSIILFVKSLEMCKFTLEQCRRKTLYTLLSVTKQTYQFGASICFLCRHRAAMQLSNWNSFRSSTAVLGGRGKLDTWSHLYHPASRLNTLRWYIIFLNAFFYYLLRSCQGSEVEQTLFWCPGLQLRCLDGYVPTEAMLYCYGTQLRPSSFQCLPSSTYSNYQLPGSLPLGEDFSSPVAVHPPSGVSYPAKHMIFIMQQWISMTTSLRIAKAWSKNLATSPLRDSFVLACHKDDFSQAMHCASMLSAATLLQRGDMSSVTAPDVEEFVMRPLGPDKALACYKLESNSACRSLEVSGANLLQSSEVHFGVDTYQLSLAVLTDTKAVICFQRGLGQWICQVVTSTMSLGSELATSGTLSGLAITSPDPSQVIACTASSDQDRATTCHLLLVSNSDSLSISSSLLVSQGANFLAAESFPASSFAAICFSDWSGSSAAVCKLLQISGSSLLEAGNVTVDTGNTKYLTMTPVRGDRLLLCFERQGPQGQPCVDERLQCPQWAEAGECAYNPKYMETLCRHGYSRSSYPCGFVLRWGTF